MSRVNTTSRRVTYQRNVNNPSLHPLQGSVPALASRACARLGFGDSTPISQAAVELIPTDHTSAVDGLESSGKLLPIIWNDTSPTIMTDDLGNATLVRHNNRQSDA